MAVLAVSLPRPLAAQVPTPTIDTLPPDSARIDSLRRESTDRLLAAEALTTQRVPTLPDLGGEGPRAAGSRLVLDRRDIAWRTAQTVSDLLTEIPGVYVWRGGWFGRPAYVNYHGRGATSIDWVIDGVPYVPLGPDSVGVEPSLFSLFLLERVEVERWPGGLRVLLYTSQYGGLAPRSRVGITTGQFDIARYQGDLEYRWKNGLGLTAAAEYFHSPTATGLKSDATVVNGLYRVQYVPHPGLGMQVQLLRTTPTRRAFQTTTTDTLGAFLKGARNDLQVRVFAQRGSEERHFRGDVLFFRSSWASDTFRMIVTTPVLDTIGVTDSVDQHQQGGALLLSLQRPRWRIGGSTWVRDRWTPLTVRAEGGYVPMERLAVNVEATHELHDGDRTSDWIGIRGSLALPLGFEFEGGLRNGHRVIAPAIGADTAQDIGEVELRGRWDLRFVTLEAGWSRTEAFAPYRFAPYLQIDSLRAFGRTEWLELGAVLTPVNWLRLEGWYSDPQGTSPDGVPPTHTTLRGEIRSRFLRKFPSGIFELRLAGEMETWGTGVIGTDGVGNPVPLRGATFFRLAAGLKLGGFQFFWDRVNTQSTKRTYVPGFKIPNLGQTFGMRWEFTN